MRSLLCGSQAPSCRALAHEASDPYGYPAGHLARYFEKLRYRMGSRERAGFYTFLEMARDVGEPSTRPSSASSRPARPEPEPPSRRLSAGVASVAASCQGRPSAAADWICCPIDEGTR